MVTISEERSDDFVIVKLSGQHSPSGRDTPVRDKVMDLVQAGIRKIIVDLGELTKITSSGIGDLVSAYTGATTAGARLLLLHLPTKLNELLHVTQLITVFEVYDNIEDAKSRLA